MGTLELKRSYLDNGTFGKLYYKAEFICHTVERPWDSNKKNISCIPAGSYVLKRHTSKKYPNSFYLENRDLGVALVDAHRTGILIHVANFVHELEGCIAPGLNLHSKVWGVAHSKLALDNLNKLITEGKDWKINIT